MSGKSRRQRYAFFPCCAYKLASKHMPAGNSPHTASIHILDNDSLLHIFYLYRPAIFDGDDTDVDRIRGGKGSWNRELWWYKPAQVCQRWRKVILGSSSYLGLCLVCTYGTPVADMLTHSPPLPLVVDYYDDDDDKDCDITEEDEEGIILALRQRHRVRRIRFRIPIPDLQKFIVAIDEEYPVLEFLIMMPSTEDNGTAMVLPETFQAPHLHHLMLEGFVLPIGSRLLTAAVGLVTLGLCVSHPSTYFQPNTLLRWISFMSQLEALLIFFSSPNPNRYVERQLMHTPITTHIPLPNLRLFGFRGDSDYMEAIVHRITTPRLEKLIFEFFQQLIYSIPRLLQFMNTAENLRLDSAIFEFSSDEVNLDVYPPEEAADYALSIYLPCWHLDWQVSSMAQIFDSHNQIFSTVEHLTLEHKVHTRSSEGHNEVDRTEWRKLLELFSNVKTLRVDHGLVKELSRSLRLDDGEHPLDLLPELQELTYSGNSDTGDVFTSFIDARQNAGHPVTLVRPSPRSVTPLSRSSSSSLFDASDVMTGNSEVGDDIDTQA